MPARAAGAEAARHEHGVGAVEQARAAFLFQRLRFHPLDVDPRPVREAAVIERLVERLVGVLVAGVLADDVNRDLVGGVLDAVDQVFPRLHVGFALRQPQQLQQYLVESLFTERQRHLVNRRHIPGGDHGLFGHVAEQADLLLQVAGERAVGAAEQHVRLDADRAQVAHAVLRGLGLQLARGADIGHQREVHVDRVLAAHVLAELADGLEERQAFDVANGAADLDQHHVDVPAHRPDAVLDLVGDVRNDLHGAAEVVAATFLLKHRHVDLAGRPVAVARRGHAREALVVPQVQVGFGPVVGDVDLAVLVRAHRAGVDVDVGVELLHRDAVAVPLEQRADGGGGQSLAE